MTEFVELRAKSYAFSVEEEEIIKAKGIRGHVVKKHTTLDNHKKCLFGEPNFNSHTENFSIRSFQHKLVTIRSNKFTFNSYDEKRYVLNDRIHTLAHGHYKIE